MATVIDANVVSKRAGADLTAKQWHMVKQNSAGDVVPITATTDIPFGILENAPASGKEAFVRIRGVGKMIASAAINAGVVVGPTNAGQAVTVAVAANAPGVPYLGISYNQVANANEYVMVRIAPGFVG